MWSMMNQILVAVDDFVWGVPLMILIMSGGVLSYGSPGPSSDPAPASGVKMDVQK